ncbi:MULTISPECIES: dermonecrotic toxin domain-containing protein [unclassified Pseudomonas]|uniref:dermonecrotic toxin domain-containing protein n=1 Tax=unclassified Pseudomonas TaxID=196821 RepID=UPI00159FF5EF|nr:MULTISPECIES: DUF6543 domain-containing protein [unclassified Pseudomonas]NWC94865.1 hypothetical protein [Pseudomonas sp. IPO3779]NWD15937.1 hypothetical protein [Pseudomonas sp. IPO3778]
MSSVESRFLATTRPIPPDDSAFIPRLRSTGTQLPLNAPPAVTHTPDALTEQPPGQTAPRAKHAGFGLARQALEDSLPADAPMQGVRQRRSSAPSVSRDPNTSTRAEADEDVANSLANAADPQADTPLAVPPQSTLGQWLSQLRTALLSPAFQAFIQEAGFDPSSIKFLPSTSSLNGMINGRLVRFTIESAGGSNIAIRNLAIAEANVIGSGLPAPLSYTEVMSGTLKTSMVNAFYDDSFPSALKSEKARGPQALAMHRRIVGDVYDKDNLAQQLKRISTRLDTGQITPATLPSVLATTEVNLQPGSTYDQLHATEPGGAASLERFLKTLGKPLPENREQVDQLVTFLTGNVDLFSEETMLTVAYSHALRQAAAGKSEPSVTVPSHSLLGRWLDLYRGLFDHEAVQAWLVRQNVDPGTLKVVPATGQATALVNGSPTTFDLADDSGWATIAGPILAVGNLIAPGAEQSLQMPRLSRFIDVPVNMVARFYNEPPTDTAAQALERAEYLEHRGAFDSLLATPEHSIPSLEHHQQQAATFYDNLGRAMAEKRRFEHIVGTTAAQLPNARAEAKKSAEAIIFKLTGKTVDADTIYHNRFDTARTSEELSHRRIKSSLRLPDALLKNFSEADWVPGMLDATSGLYTDPEGYGEHHKFALAPSEVMNESWKTDLQTLMTTQLDNFWDQHRDDFRTILKGRFIAQARQQWQAYEARSPAEQATLADEQKFTRDDYLLVMAAASNVSADERAPITVEQLQASTATRGVVRAYPLDINGYGSDIVRFTAQDDGQYLYSNGRRDGRQVLYVPGGDPDFVRFDSLEKMDQWIVDQARDPEKRKALASHFSVYDRQDGISYYGVDTSLARLATNQWDQEEGITIDRGNIRIHGDVFQHITDVTEKRMSSDADLAIKSNSEVIRDAWLNDITVGTGLLAKLAPTGIIAAGVASTAAIAETALGVEKSVSGDTLAERSDGALKAADGALNALFSAGASSVPEDPFVLPGAGAPSTLPLQRETFFDGAPSLVTEQSLAEDAYVIPRSDGFDVVDGEKVYRYNPEQPGQLTDLESAAHEAELQNYEAICPVPSAPGGRVRRGANDECFSRIIVSTGNELQQELQALEHERLLPSPRKLFNSDRFVVRERRLHKMVDTELGAKLVPLPTLKPIEYKTLIDGKIIDDPHFGLPSGTTNKFLEAETRVVKLGSISPGVNDQREMRGIVVSSPRAGDPSQYLVVEADTAEFYYVKLTTPESTNVTFTKCGATEFELALAKKYRSKFYVRQGNSAHPNDANFIALPKLKDAYASLEKNGYSKADIAQLKATTATMNAEQQREVVFQLQTRGALGQANISMMPNKVSALTKPSHFASFTEEQKNRFYAMNAKESVDRAMKATGLGPSNQVRSVADIKRADAANEALVWLRKTANPRTHDLGAQALKSGAGNCGEMSLLARDIIAQSGGNAYTWSAGDAHAFTVVGGPSILPGDTVDFSQPQWADAWIVDPWAEIACPARQYTAELEATMNRWAALGWKIRDGANPNMSPLDRNWTNTLFNLPKSPDGQGYIQPALSA